MCMTTTTTPLFYYIYIRSYCLTRRATNSTSSRNNDNVTTTTNSRNNDNVTTTTNSRSNDNVTTQYPEKVALLVVELLA